MRVEGPVFSPGFHHPITLRRGGGEALTGFDKETCIKVNGAVGDDIARTPWVETGVAPQAMT